MSMTPVLSRRQAKVGAITMQHKLAASLAITALILAQLNTPGTYNGGVPQVPGTRVPESNPATSLSVPQSYSPSSLSAPTMGTSPAAVPSGNTGPAYSFGAAPPPIVSPAR
jgi:hypothetical protein